MGKRSLLACFNKSSLNALISTHSHCATEDETRLTEKSIQSFFYVQDLSDHVMLTHTKTVNALENEPLFS